MLKYVNFYFPPFAESAFEPVEGAGVFGLLFKGWPTVMSHLCPGSPCGGFIPGKVFTGCGVPTETVCGAGVGAVVVAAPFVNAGTGLASMGCPT